MTTIDISEESLARESTGLLRTLLKDRTTNKSIVWATHSYELLGKGFGLYDRITPSKVTGPYANLIQPRSEKSKYEQKDRTKVRAEVFTPTWLVKQQIDAVDQDFQDQDLETYLDLKWLEITCGEAPYMVSRYDTVTGQALDLEERVGFLDRKLHRLSEEVHEEEAWFQGAMTAYQNAYGYEYQGDSLLLARENLLASFIDYYQAKFDQEPSPSQKQTIAQIISYNVLQMDGLTYTSPNSQQAGNTVQLNLFEEIAEQTSQPQKAQIKDWKTNELIDFERLSQGESPMKFDVVIGNPPYQSETKKLLYPDFYLGSKEIANNVVLIFPTGWQDPKNNNGLEKLNTKEVKNDKQIVQISNIQNAFPGLAGVEWTNIIFWKNGHDNGLLGKQKILKNGKDPEIVQLLTDKKEIPKPEFIETLSQIVTNREDFISVKTITSARKPYGLTTDFLKKIDKAERDKLHDGITDGVARIKIYSTKNNLFADESFIIPKLTPAYDSYKVFIPDAWGNMSPKTKYLGGSFASVIIASPKEICTGTYIESGKFNTFEEAQKHAKYFLTKFFRALLFANKHSIINSTAWGSVPLQDYSEDFWNLSIEEIDKYLIDKYGIPTRIAREIESNIQPRDETYIVNYKSIS